MRLPIEMGPDQEISLQQRRQNEPFLRLERETAWGRGACPGPCWP